MGNFCILGAMFLWLVSPAKADTIKILPEEVEYSNAIGDDYGARLCKIELTSFTVRRPEAFAFIFFVGRGKSDGRLVGPILTGYTLDVGRVTWLDGKINGLNKRTISNSGFASATFNSSGRLFPVDYQDGGIAETTTDGDTGTKFMRAFYLGIFRISFHDGERGTIREYAVVHAVSKTVIQTFDQCLATLRN